MKIVVWSSMLFLAGIAVSITFGVAVFTYDRISRPIRHSSDTMRVPAQDRAGPGNAVAPGPPSHASSGIGWVGKLD